MHQGHAQIIERLNYHANQVSGKSVVFSFDPHPVRLLRPEMAPPPLTWTKRKAELLAAIGVDALIAYPTNMEMLQKTPVEFFESVIVEKISAKAIVEGPNFFFGKGRAGTTETLLELSSQHGIDAEIVNPKIDGESLISSSRIRELIRLGDVESARRMLTQPYRIRGLVSHGAGRGATIGFPTANLEGIDVLLPPLGIYSGRVNIGEKDYAAAIHIGPSPTFGDKATKTEVFVLNFNNSLYGETLEVDFFSKLRDIRSFPSQKALTDQLSLDVDLTQQHFETYQGEKR